MQKRKSVLVVEDDPDLRRLYRLTLAIDGFVVHESGDGIEALRAIEQNTPDLVLLDLDLPKLNGFSVQQEIVAHPLTQNVPVVIVTALEVDLSQLAVACVLRKPVAPEQLVATVRACLGSAAPSALF